MPWIAGTGTPASFPVVCPRCKVFREFFNVDGGSTFRCSGCEWYWSLGTQAPTGTSNALLAVGGTAISVASGGASFTNGMVLLFDTGNLSLQEVLVVNGAATGTSIPVASAGYWPTIAGAIKAHATAATFGQLLLTPTLAGAGQDAVPAAPGWGF